jgi:hypothetical protein
MQAALSTGTPEGIPKHHKLVVVQKKSVSVKAHLDQHICIIDHLDHFVFLVLEIPFLSGSLN